MKKRTLALLLAMAMAASAFVGCSSNAGNESSKKEESSKESSTADDSSEESEEEPAELFGLDYLQSLSEPAVVSMLYPDNASYPLLKDWLVLQLIEENANVKLDLSAVPEADWDVKKEVIFNSGNIPDLIGKTFAKTAEVASGILLPISQYEDQMPTFQAYIDKIGAKENLESTRYADGEYYSFPAKCRPTQLQDKQWMIRQDIFTENGIETPTTMEEIYEAGLKLLEVYPDSTPISNRFTGNNILSCIAAGFGAIAGWNLGDGMLYDYDTQTWAFSPISDEYKDYIMYTNKLVSSGVMDKEFLTLDSTTYEQKAIQGEMFILCDWAVNITRYETVAQETTPDYDMAVIYPPTGTDDNYAIGWIQYWNQAYVLPASLGEEGNETELKEVLAFLDWGYTDEAELITSWGVEGETFKYDDAGHITSFDPAIDNALAYGTNNNALCPRQHIDVIIYNSVSADEVKLFDQIAADGIVPDPNPTSPLTTEQIEEVQVYSTTLTDYVSSQGEKFIFGTAEEIEAGWDAYVEECIAKGANDLADLYNGK